MSILLFYISIVSLYTAYSASASFTFDMTDGVSGISKKVPKTDSSTFDYNGNSYNAVSPGSVAILNVNTFHEMNSLSNFIHENCKSSRDGSNYTGYVAHSAFGNNCKPWSDAQDVYPTLVNDSNYCRNPIKNPYGPYCITATEPSLKLEYCLISMCTEPKPGTHPECVKNRFDTQREYRGKVNTTIYGERCLPWFWWGSMFQSEDFTDDSVDEALNYCRNPSNGSRGPWCIVRDDDGVYMMNRPCAIPICDMSDDLNDEYMKHAATASTKTNSWDIAVKIQLIFYPIIVLIGTVLNILSVAVFVRPKLRHSPTPLLLTILAFLNISNLFMGALGTWLQLVTGLYLSASSDLSCQIYNYIGYSLSLLPGWILVVVIIDRTVAISWPLRARSICTRKNAMYSVMIISICSLFLNMPQILGAAAAHEIVFDMDNVHFVVDPICGCTVQSWWWINAITESIVPFILMFSGNIVLITLLVKARHKRLSMSVSSHPENNLQFLTILLLSTAFAYLLFTSPYMIYHFIGSHLKNKYLELNSFDEWRSADRLSYVCICSVLYINSSINFLLYCLSGKTFRDEFKTMCKDFTLKCSQHVGFFKSSNFTEAHNIDIHKKVSQPNMTSCSHDNITQNSGKNMAVATL